MPDTYFFPSKAISRFKKRAKLIHRETGKTHNEALEEIARGFGLPNWHHLTLHADASRHCELAFANDLIVAYDLKEAENVDTALFTENLYLFGLCRKPLIARFRDGDEDKWEPESETEYERMADEYRLFVRTGGTAPEKLEDAVELVQSSSFFPPEVFWWKGTLYEGLGAHPVLPQQPIPEHLMSAFGAPARGEKLISPQVSASKGTGVNGNVADSYSYCIHCERAYPEGAYRQKLSWQLCPYADCDGDTVIDNWGWRRIRKENPGYPEVPELGVQYPMHGPNYVAPKNPKQKTKRKSK
ncbi:hypothetical protein [Stenotrophobium rhamnosiphilum]|nr:hypothetical protein [Stenotrophobium rhamnosiphilum]